MLTDAEAMDAIAAVLSGSVWDADTMNEVADIVRRTGRVIVDSGACEVEGCVLSPGHAPEGQFEHVYKEDLE